MSAAWAHVDVSEGRRLQDEWNAAGIPEAERQSRLEAVAGYFILNRGEFGLLELEIGAGRLKLLVIRLRARPDRVTVLASNAGELDPGDLQYFREVFRDKLGG